jgi:hypothetical protein
MKTFLRFSMALLLTAVGLFQTQLRAGDKKPEPAKEIVVNGELMNSDLKDKVRQNMFCKTYTYKMIEGRNYQLDMKSAALDSYLRLEDPNGTSIAEDDDSGGFPDARIVIRAPKTGDYTIVCTTFAASATGKFTLIVKDLTGGPVPKEEKKGGEKKDKIQQPEPSGESSLKRHGEAAASFVLVPRPASAISQLANLDKVYRMQWICGF